jgi:hypothetical protein
MGTNVPENHRRFRVWIMKVWKEITTVFLPCVAQQSQNPIPQS